MPRCWNPYIELLEHLNEGELLQRVQDGAPLGKLGWARGDCDLDGSRAELVREILKDGMSSGRHLASCCDRMSHASCNRMLKLKLRSKRLSSYCGVRHRADAQICQRPHSFQAGVPRHGGEGSLCDWYPSRTAWNAPTTSTWAACFVFRYISGSWTF